MGSRGFHDFIHHYRYKLYIYSTYTYYICIKLSMKRNCTRRVIILRNALLPFCLRDARGSSANISAKGFQLHLWLFSLCLCFVPFYPSLSLSLSRSFARFLRTPTNSISFLCTSRFFATSLRVASVWVTTGAT